MGRRNAEKPSDCQTSVAKICELSERRLCRFGSESSCPTVIAYPENVKKSEADATQRSRLLVLGLNSRSRKEFASSTSARKQNRG